MSVRKIEISKGVTRWEARAYENGRGSPQLCKRFEKKADADAWLAELKQKRAERDRNPFSTLSFQEKTFITEAEYWILDGQHRFSPGHTVKSKAMIKDFLERFGDMPVQGLTPEFLSRYQQAELKKGLRPNTVNRKTEIVTAILNHSVRHRRIPFNPSFGFKKLFKAQKEMSSWNNEEASSFLTFTQDRYPPTSAERWVYVVYLLALNTGMRAGEIWGLQPGDLNEAHGTITVRRQFNRVSMKFTETKSKKRRIVPCNPELMKELKLIIETDKLKGETTIFRNDAGKPVCHDNFADRRFLKDLKAWGGKTIRFHDIRHTAATLLIANNVDVKTVKEICGHSDITTTMGYVHLVSGAIEKVAQTFSVSPEIKGVDRNLKLVK